MRTEAQQLLLILGILMLLAFIPSNHDATVSIMITLQTLNSLKEGREE